ncbi:MAG: TonB-dependent receptor [Acidobacteria bacterium]|nr:TonB-dependent receptor [Acidobacteriota bacterium]
MKFRTVNVLLPALSMISAGLALAQEYRGRIQGTVSDSSNALVVGATVTLRNNNTGFSAVRLTDATGHYLFDLVEPGSYTVNIELQGFNRFLQENVLVENRADVTVNAKLVVGGVAETVTVTASPVAVKFNTTTMELTVDNTMVNSLPIVARNPFTLALLNPAVVSRYTAQKNPFFMWAASTVEVGGAQSRTSDVLVDGMPVMLGPKSSYAPTMDNTTEVTVQQNSVDAEYGHSSGGVLNVSMKSGTNEVHGTAYYFGRNPSLNAVSNPLSRAPNLVRNHIWGGTIGQPIKKNRIFNFFAYEQWRQRDPQFDQRRMMTAIERQGDFSQSLNINGGLRTIYDPWTSRLEGSQATREPFPGNVIPRSRMDPTSLKLLAEMWDPNRPGSDITGRDNFAASYTRNLYYHNISNRTDFILSENVRSFFRFSRFRTKLEDLDYTPNKSRLFSNPNGGAMHALNVSGDVVWTINPRTVLNVRGNYISNVDDYDAPEQYASLATYKEFFPNATDFYTRYLDFGAPFYYPGINIGGGSPGGGYGKPNWWFQHPQAFYDAVKVSRQAGRHFLKAGFELRTLRVDAIRPQTFRFSFRDDETANTFVSPNTRLSGDAWASFLLGAMNPGDSWGRHEPFKKDTSHYYGAYIQDDFKLNRNVTLNLGLRYEYEGAIFDRGGTYRESRFEPNRYSRGLDVSSPIPEFQGAGQPGIPAQALALMDRPYQWNGAWLFTEEETRGMWDPRGMILLPRAGIAVRLSDRTSLRVGYARFNTPSVLQRKSDVLGSTPVPGFGANTPVAPNLEGRPQQRLSDPFPPGVNPVIPPVGKGDGRYTQMGASATWDKRDLVTGVNDRFNFTFQRETVARFLVEATYFFNLGRDRPYTLNLNQVNPQIINTERTALRQTVPNPFYRLLPENQMRGPLRNQRTVALQDLLRPFPHYTGVQQLNTDGIDERYHSLQLRVQRPFANGFNFLLAYNYNRESQEEFFNKEEQFFDQFRWEDGQRPRHRMTLASTYEFPFGRGRRFLSQSHPIADAILGGWTMSGIYWYYAGNRLRFGQMDVVGEPRIDSPDKWGRMFDPNAFRFNSNAAFEVRTNPKSYAGIQGPGYKNIDFNVAKFFRISERIQLEFKMEAYNLTNTFSGADPVLNVTSSAFGRVTAMAAGTQGRELQYNLRLHF